MAAERKLQLGPTLAALDRKDRGYYDRLDDDQKKEFSGYLLLRYCSAVQGSHEMEHYLTASANHYANKNMFDLSKHKKLQWLMLTAASPGIGSLNHKWLKQKPKPKDSNSPIRKELARLFPNMKESDLDVLSKLVTKKELSQYVKAHGED